MENVEIAKAFNLHFLFLFELDRKPKPIDLFPDLFLIDRFGDVARGMHLHRFEGERIISRGEDNVDGRVNGFKGLSQFDAGDLRHFDVEEGDIDALILTLLQSLDRIDV